MDTGMDLGMGMGCCRRGGRKRMWRRRLVSRSSFSLFPRPRLFFRASVARGSLVLALDQQLSLPRNTRLISFFPVSLSSPASLSHLPPHAFQSSSEHLAFTSQIDDLTHRLQNDPPSNGTLAERTARQLRKEIKNLPSEIEKDGSAGAAGSVAELWWKLMWTGDAKIMSEYGPTSSAC